MAELPMEVKLVIYENNTSRLEDVDHLGTRYGTRIRTLILRERNPSSLDLANGTVELSRGTLHLDTLVCLVQSLLILHCIRFDISENSLEWHDMYHMLLSHYKTLVAIYFGHLLFQRVYVPLLQHNKTTLHTLMFHHTEQDHHV